MPTSVVFVHGWSVTNTNTYGKMPERLANEARELGLDLSVKHVYLGRYISFHDEVRVKDIARAFDRALSDAGLGDGSRFVCITHSTGGPVVREWWHRYHQGDGAPKCPMSHLIMLAPANYGSALAVLGKGRVSRLKSWFSGVEPGQGVLDWLALGSDPAWRLNHDWTVRGGEHVGPGGVFPFVITGQTIDRKFYDNLNSYTGELGSDGVVRVAAANLRANYVRLVQEAPTAVPGGRGKYHAPRLVPDAEAAARGPVTPLLVVAGKAHSGTSKGIMRSVRAAAGTAKDQQTVDAILACIQVTTRRQYDSLATRFASETDEVQQRERCEKVDNLFRDSYFVHDRFAMVIFRVIDHEGFPVHDFDLVLTAGKDDDPNHLPKGFCADRQRNPNSPNTITYLFNHSIMTGCPKVVHEDGTEVRPEQPGTTALGFRVTARPEEGFAHYYPCSLRATSETLEKVLEPNTTTMVDIVLHRAVGEETFRLDRGTDSRSFKSAKPGKPVRDVDGR